MRDHHCALDAFLASAGVPWDELQQAQGFVPLERMMALSDAAIALSQDPALALHFGASMSQQTALVLQPLLLNCASLRVAIREAQRYFPLLASDVSLAFQERESSAEITFYPAIREARPLRFALEFGLAWILSTGRMFVGMRTSAMEVHLPYPAPSYAAEYAEVMRCPVVFDAPHAKICFDRAFLDAQNPSGGGPLLQVLREQAETLLAQREASEPLHRRVRSLLKNDPKLLAEGDLETLGRVLGISARSLRRRLVLEGVPFRAVRDEVRKEQAFHLVAETRVPLREVAERLGFSEMSPFYRAFKRWSDGKTPADFRGAALLPRLQERAAGEAALRETSL